MNSHHERNAEAIGHALLQTAQAQEAVLEEQLHQYDALLNDETALQQLRAKRMQELQAQQQRQRQWQRAGHGQYVEISGAKDFFETSKQSENVVVHFYRPTTMLSEVFHMHLTKLAAAHLETKFVKINVEKGDPSTDYLVEKLGIVVMPTLVLVKNRKAVHHVRGFDELGGTEFRTKRLAQLLSHHDILKVTDEEEDDEDDDELRPCNGVNAIRLNKENTTRANRFDEDS